MFNSEKRPVLNLLAQTSFISKSKKIIKEIQKRWKFGDYDQSLIKDNYCPNLFGTAKNVDSNYLICNEDYLNCFIENKLKKTINFTSYKNLFGESNFYKIYSQAYTGTKLSESSGVIIELTSGQDKLKVLFKRNCSEIKLPKRIYITTENNKEMLWDNYNLNLYIDKYPISVREVNRWIGVDHEAPRKKAIEDTLSWFRPSINLSLRERQAFCAFRGARLLETHVKDAATILPADLANPLNKFLKVYPYYWTKNTRSVFAYKARNTKYLDELMSLRNCRKIFSKECTKFPFNFYTTDTVSWSGMYMLLGGNPEVMRNTLDRFKNLKLSSVNYEIDSSVHELTKRGIWNESEVVNAAFRCMREK
ncbi:hypothetical protein N9B72_00535 [Bacteriovoracaceae bacterium]|nr:hypothetical protein [Bacteriovoracaceae bacterium]